MQARRALVPVVMLLLVGGAGCGNSGDREQATAAAGRFFAAIESNDGATACAQLSADTRKALVDDEGKPCPDAIGALKIEPGAVDAVEVFSTNAKADLDNGQSAFLSLTSQGWRLSAVGCKPGDGPPSDVPMDCELEA